jgi:trimeric autotransporter adhesin
VRTNGAVTYTALTPLQALTPAPYAIFANTASNLLGKLAASQLSGSIPLGQLPAGVVTNNESNVTLSGTLSGNGTGLTNVNAATLHGIDAANFWQLTGNNGTTPGVNYVGTADNQPLELHVNAQRALRLEAGGPSALGTLDGFPNPTGAPNVIGGSPFNFVAAGVVGSVIGGGGATNFLGRTFTNSIAEYSDFSIIGSGIGNSVQYSSTCSAIGGGVENTIGTNSGTSFIGGGSYNIIETNDANSTIGGGGYNQILNNSYYSTIAGGAENSIDVSLSFIGGGQENTIENNSDHAVIDGGWFNAIGQNNYEGVIAGGYYNSMGDDSGYSFIGGGQYNVIQANSGNSSIAGGESNNASGDIAVVGGGLENASMAFCSVVGGGQNNTNRSQGGTIAGGQNNYIQTGFQSAILGGFNNYVGADYATIGGGNGNATYSPGSFIGGGGWDGTTNGANIIHDNAATIAGGLGNEVISGGPYSFIGGGSFNTVSGNNATLSGGYENEAEAYFATVGGGQNNTNGSQGGTIAGGQNNYLQTGFQGAIGGGYGNKVSGDYATVPGGAGNNAEGSCSIACGNGAIAQAANTFVWADGAASTFASGGEANTFNVRATGGVWLWSAANASGGGTAGVELKPGATSWSVLSDRNAKKNFKAVNTEAVLEKLAAIPIQQWNYKWEKDDDVPNIGPMAQDFKHAFFPGRDDKSINTLEFDGVELAAIQGLNQKLNEKDAEIEALKAKADKVDLLEKQNDSLAARLSELEATVKALAERK